MAASLKIPIAILNIKDLTLAERCTLAFICSRSKDGECTMSDQQIASELHVDECTVTKIIERLLNKHHIEVEYDFDNNKRFIYPEDYSLALDPCPFCGKEPHIEVVEPHTHSAWLKTQIPDLPDCEGEAFVICENCSAAISGKTETEVIEKWNHRANLTELPYGAEDE